MKPANQNKQPFMHKGWRKKTKILDALMPLLEARLKIAGMISFKP